MLENELRNLGLGKNETQVYLFLLAEGLSSPPRIAEGTGIARTNTYHLLRQLSDMGLIEEQVRGSRKLYLAKDPQALLERLNRQQEAMQRLLPDLRALHATQKNKPNVRFYDGWDQVRAIYEQTYQAKEVYAIGSTRRLMELDPAFFRAFERTYQQRGIVLRDILTRSSEAVAEEQTRPTLKGYYDHVYLPSASGDPQTDILIWENSVALISLEEPLFGTVMTHVAVAQSMRLLAQVLMQQLRGV